MHSRPPSPLLEQINASAGSGKTYTLTSHFLRLLKGSAHSAPAPCARPGQTQPPVHAFSEILAATFTNRAAAEMKDRIMRGLKVMALSGPLSDAEAMRSKEIFSRAEAAAWVEAILRHYDSLNIRTIDSLLTMLARLSALELGLPPNFEPNFDKTRWLTPLYDAYLADSAYDGHGQNAQNIHAACLSILHQNASKGFSAGNVLRDGALSILNLYLEKNATPCLDEGIIRQAFARRAQALKQKSAALLQMVEQNALAPNATFLKMLNGCLSFPNFELPHKSFSVFASKAGLAECLNKAGKDRVDDAAEAAYSAFCRAYRNCWQEGGLLLQALFLLPLARIAADLLPLVQDLQNRSGQIPAARLHGLAEQALCGAGGVSEACCRMGSRLTHLLIDEFQDTSRSQWAAIAPLAVECLSRGGSLSYVGDVKQAIYNWRGGDAALFGEIAEDAELTAIAGKAKRINLEYNWRSAPAIVRHNNAFFGRLAENASLADAVMQELLPNGTPPEYQAQGVALLQQAFTACRQQLPPVPKLNRETDQEPGQELNNAPEGLARFYNIVRPDEEDLKETLKERLKALFNNELALRHAPGSIAVLVRANEEAALISGWLLEWGWPVLTENSFNLAAHPLIRRLIALLTFLDYPLDDMAFWSFVSGPECFAGELGLQMEEMEEWLMRLRGQETNHRKRPLFMWFKESFPEQWGRWLEPFYSQAGLMSAYDTLSEVYRHYALLERLPEHAVFLRRLLEIAHGAEGLGYSSLAAFLSFWREQGGEEKVPMPEGLDAVRVMTMHKAKGLEFPVVVLPFHNFPDVADRQYVMAELEGLTFLTRSGKHLEKDYYSRKLNQALEKINLLYVAWTRPVEELHAFVGLHSKTHSSFGKALRLMLAPYNLEDDGAVYQEGALPEAQNKLEAMRSAPGETVDEAATAPFSLRRRSSFKQSSSVETWRPMDWLPRLKIHSNPLEGSVVSAKERGIFLHRTLELLQARAIALPYIGTAPQGEAVPPQELAQSLLAPLENTLRALALASLPLTDANAEEEALAEAKETLSWFLNLPGSMDWLRHGRAEKGLLNAKGEKLRVDLLVDEGPNGLLVLDYKSGQADPAHARQMRAYIEALGQAVQRPVRGLLLYLDEKRLETVEL